MKEHAAPRASAQPTVQLENDRVRVTEWRFPPGGATGWHRHAHDYVVVPLSTGRLLIQDGAGNTEAELVAGRSYYRPAGAQHDVVNVNPHEFVFIEVELKIPGAR